jgi:hypothetical protein
MKRVTSGNYKKEECYSQVVWAVSGILTEKDMVTPIEVFERLGHLKPSMVEDWRFAESHSLKRRFSAISLTQMQFLGRSICMPWSEG